MVCAPVRSIIPSLKLGDYLNFLVISKGYFAPDTAEKD